MSTTKRIYRGGLEVTIQDTQHYEWQEVIVALGLRRVFLFCKRGESEQQAIIQIAALLSFETRQIIE